MDEISGLLSRGVANVIPSKELLEKELRSGKKLNIYLGIDPTGVNIHLGHAVNLKKLQKLSEIGHNVTFLVGDFTALIGDTSDKESERPLLTAEQIAENLKTYKEQASKILDFSKVSIKFNSEWLKSLSFEDIVKLTKHFSLNDFISRELIKKRLDENKSVGLLETLYPLMQGYDSYYLDTNLQIGGTDQTFNMQAGRTLQKILRNKESFVLSMNFLTGTDGRKMSKTWNNAIWIRDSAETKYGKVMSLKDDLIVEYFLLATDISTTEIKSYEERLKNGENPMGLKKLLAFTIVEMYNGKDEAKLAQESFVSVVQNKEVPKDIEELKISNGNPLSKILIEKGLVSSISEWKRLVEQRGVTIDDQKIESPFINTSNINNGGILKIGKRKYAKIVKE